MTLIPKNTQRKNRIFNPDTRFGSYQLVKVQAPYSSGTPTTFATGSGGAGVGRGISASIGEGVDFYVQIPISTAQGDGCGFGSVTVNPKEQGSMCEFSFFYKKESGTMDGSQTSTHSMEIWIRDQSNGAWIQPIGYRNIANVTGNVNKCQCFFQVPSNATILYLCLLNNNAAAAYQLGISDCYFGLVQTAESGFPASDWQSFTPTLSLAGNATSQGYWRRIGDSMEIMGSIVFGSTLPTGNYWMTVPLGYVFDTSKITGGNINLGNANLFTATSGAITGTTTLYYGNGFGFVSGLGVWWNATTPVTLTAGDVLYFNCKAPILGWASNQQMASQLGNQPRECVVTNIGQTTILSGVNKYLIDTVELDKSGMFDLSNNWIKVLNPGVYCISARVPFVQSTGSLQTVSLWIAVNTNLKARSEASTISTVTQTVSVNWTGYLNAGDYIEIYTIASSNHLTSGAGWNEVSAIKIPNPSASIPSPNILSVYGSTSGVLLPTSPTNYNWEVKVTDLTGAVTTGASWQFVAQVSGPYNFAFNLVTNYSSTINAIHMAVRVNSTTVDYGYGTRLGPYSSLVQTRCAGTTWMNAGDVMICWAWQDTSVDTTFPDVGLNRAMIVYVGR